MRGPGVAMALVLAVFAGCLGGPTDDLQTSPDVPPAPTSVLSGTLEPGAMDAPTFRLSGAIAQGGPVYGAGEPSIWAAMDGVIYVAFPGCDDGPYYLAQVPGSETCGHGLVWKSTDGGATFERLNSRPDGRLTDDGPAANGDADVAVDSAGTVYVSNLGGGIQFHRSEDAGRNWTYVGNIVPTLEDDAERHEGADRQWLAAAGPGHVINTWMRTSPNRDVAINTTFDGGRNWTGTTYFGDNIGWIGTVQIAPDGQHAYIPYTQREPVATGPDARECTLHVVVTENGGRNWTSMDTGVRIQTNHQGMHWSCVQMAPAIDVSGDGTVLVVWSEDVNTVGDVSATGTRLLAVWSTDNGTTWSEPLTLAGTALVPDMGPLGTPVHGATIMPWVVGGAGDRFAITYLETVVAGDTDYVATHWSVAAMVLDGLGGELRQVTSVIEEGVHQGGICTRGGGCTTSGSDRALLDFFESDLRPDGHLVVVYPADPLSGGKTIDIRVAVQDGGTPLLELPPAPV